MKDELVAIILKMHKSGILYSEGVREFKRRFLESVLAECQGNQCKAARMLGMHRNTLSRTLAELKVDMHRRELHRIKPNAVAPNQYYRRAANT